MKGTVYEVHSFKNEKLPFVFHPDSTNIRTIDYNWHENVEILFVIEGEGTGFLGEEEIPLKEGDICVVNSNIVHSVSSDSARGITYECLIPDVSFFRENGINIEALELENHIRDEKASALYSNVIKEYREENFQIAGIRSAVLNLILYIVRNYSKDRIGTDIKTIRKTSENINFAVNFMKQNFKEKLTVKQIAEQSGMSKYYFLREFKKVTGVTVITFLNILRCNNAQKLISKGEAIWLAARKSGFENDSYFTKVFKKTKGILPSECAQKKGMLKKSGTSKGGFSPVKDIINK